MSSRVCCACAARVIPLRRQPRNTHRQTWCAPVPSIPSSIFSCAISARTRTSSSLCHETHGPISWRPLMASRGGRNILNDVPTLSISSAAPCRALGVLVSWCMGRYPCSRVPVPGHLSEVLAHCRHTRLPALPRRLGLGGVLASPSLRGSASSKARAPLRACSGGGTVAACARTVRRCIEADERCRDRVRRCANQGSFNLPSCVPRAAAPCVLRLRTAAAAQRIRDASTGARASNPAAEAASESRHRALFTVHALTADEAAGCSDQMTDAVVTQGSQEVSRSPHVSAAPPPPAAAHTDDRS